MLPVIGRLEKVGLLRIWPRLSARALGSVRPKPRPDGRIFARRMTIAEAGLPLIWSPGDPVESSLLALNRSPM